MKKALSALTIVCASAVLAVLPAKAAPATMPDGNIFDAVFYASQYPDVVAAFGTEEAFLYNHYLLFGKNESRLPYAGAAVATTATTTTATTSKVDGSQRDGITPLADGFDAAYYAKTYPDVVAVYGSDPAKLLEHYMTLGAYEQRKKNAWDVPQVPTTQYGKNVFDLINRYRKGNELNELKYSFEMEAAALVRAKELVKSYSHYRPSGAEYSTALPGWARNSEPHAEIIAMDIATPADALEFWTNNLKNDRGARVPIVDYRYTWGGAAYYKEPDTGHTYWVMLFGRRNSYNYDHPEQSPD